MFALITVITSSALARGIESCSTLMHLCIITGVRTRAAGARSGVPRQVLRVLEHPHHKESSRSIGITPVLLGFLARYTSTCTGTNLQVANNSYKL